MAGLKETGIVPIDPTPLLKHPCIQDGDTIYVPSSQFTGRLFQSPPVTPRTTASSSAGSSITPSTPPRLMTPPPRMEPEAVSATTSVLVPLADTPQRSAHAESLFPSISKQKPRLGRYRTLADEADTADKWLAVQQQCLSKVSAQMLAVELNIPQHMKCYKRDVRHNAKEVRWQAEEARRHAEDLERKAKWAAEKATVNAAMVLTQHKQELANLQLVHKKLTELNPRMEHIDLLVVLAEKVDDWRHVNVISMGSLSILIGRLSVSVHSSLLRSQVSGYQCSTERTPTRWLVLHETLVRTTNRRERWKATSR
jgi:hypothetical protein